MTDLYRFYDHQGRLLYVGISLHAAARAASHRADKPWWGDVARMDVEHLDMGRRAAELVEADAIRTEMPRWNVTHNQAPDLGTPWDWIYSSGDFTSRPVELMERISIFLEDEWVAQPARSILWAIDDTAAASVLRAVGLLCIEGYVEYVTFPDESRRFMWAVQFRAAADDGANKRWWQDLMAAEAAKEALC